MRILDIILERPIIRTNDEGAHRLFEIGTYFEDEEGNEYRITKHKIIPTVPWATYIVYGVKQRG